MSVILHELENLISNSKDDIIEWFNNAYSDTLPCFYSSVDLRHSGRKLAPVDTNLFPAGFNNLNEYGIALAAQEIKSFLSKYFPSAQKILLIPENHTRNLFYLDNLAVIRNILSAVVEDVVIGSIAEEAEDSFSLTSNNGSVIDISKVVKYGDKLTTQNNFTPDLIILNNDLTIGIPEILSNVVQPIIPSSKFGWHTRRKTKHFESYDNIVRDFSAKFNIDSFLISTMFHHCGAVNFKERQGIECVALGVEKVMHNLKQKYAELEIEDKPCVFIKADNGTYGMGIMVVESGEEVIEMNKKDRNKMGVIREGIINTEVIIQEGIKTIDKIDGNVAEPMIYLVGGNPIGCMYRVNADRSDLSNLNSKGMYFEKNICKQRENKNVQLTPFKLIAKLASLAAAKEIY
jgi:glutamate--cysteine ligase